MLGAPLDWFLKGLGAGGPDPQLKDRLMLFGQFVGDWDIIECRIVDERGAWKTQTGECHWNWILGGRALQDTWMYHGESTGKLEVAGTTLRFYDPGEEVWRSVWITPKYNDVGLFLGRKVGEEIVLELQEESKHQGEGKVNWIFSDIKPDSFRWRAEESMDGGRTWILKEEMRIIRSKALGPVANRSGGA